MTTSPDPDDTASSPADAWSRAWAIVLVVSTVAVVAASALGLADAIRVPVTLWFLAICPGMAVVRLLGLEQRLAEVMLAVALSVVLVGLISTVQAYLGVWSPGWALATLAAVVIGALLADRRLIPAGAWTTLVHPLRLRLTAGTLGRPVGDPSFDPTVERGIDDDGRRVPPPVVVVTRLPAQARANSASKPPSDLERALGTDPIAEDEAAVALRSAFDRVVGDIANRRERDD